MNAPTTPCAAETSDRALPQFGVLSIIVASVLAIWYGTGVAVFAQNRFMMAQWFVLTHLLVPMAAFSLGWIGRGLVLRTRSRSLTRQGFIHLCILVLATVALPLPLSAISLLPVGQTASRWTGKITACQSLFDAAGHRGSTATVTADGLGPMLLFRISTDDYNAVHQAAADGNLPTVSGSVVRGFFGLPISVRIDPIASPIQ